MELVDSSRLADLLTAANAEVVRRRRDGMILQVNLLSFDDEHAPGGRTGNPQSLVHDHETDTNPPRVWELKRV